MNGYKRYRPFSLAPDRAIWGRDNRGVMVRVLGGPGDPATHLENRVGEPAANPYLYMAEPDRLGARWAGPESRSRPVGRQALRDQAALLPRSLGEALSALAENKVLRAGLGDFFVDYYLRLKQAEIDRFELGSATGSSASTSRFSVEVVPILEFPGHVLHYRRLARHRRALHAGGRLSRGSRASVVAAFGCTLGCVPHLAAAIWAWPPCCTPARWPSETRPVSGRRYLLYMAWNTLRERGALSVGRQSDARSFVEVTIEAILINLLNPKLSIFFLAFLPQFISTDEAQPLPHMLMLSAVFMLMTFVVFAAYGLFAAAMRDHVISLAVRHDVDAPHLRRRLRSAGGQARLTER